MAAVEFFVSWLSVREMSESSLIDFSLKEGEANVSLHICDVNQDLILKMLLLFFIKNDQLCTIRIQTLQNSAFLGTANQLGKFELWICTVFPFKKQISYRRGNNRVL